MLSIFERLFRKEDLKMQEEKFALARIAEKEWENRDFVYAKINDSYIKIDERKEDSTINLMESKKLMGWDYMTTSLLAPLFNEANIVRGNIELWKTEEFPHAWLELNIDGLVFCFDPAFDIICLRSEYNKIFKPKNITKIPSFKARGKLLDYLLMGKNGTIIKGSNDINDVFYDVLAHVKGKEENGKIKDYHIKFYYN